jgi:hypothetical protein
MIFFSSVMDEFGLAQYKPPMEIRSRQEARGGKSNWMELPHSHQTLFHRFLMPREKGSGKHSRRCHGAVNLRSTLLQKELTNCGQKNEKDERTEETRRQRGEVNAGNRPYEFLLVAQGTSEPQKWRGRGECEKIASYNEAP